MKARRKSITDFVIPDPDPKYLNKIKDKPHVKNVSMEMPPFTAPRNRGKKDKLLKECVESMIVMRQHWNMIVHSKMDLVELSTDVFKKHADGKDRSKLIPLIKKMEEQMVAETQKVDRFMVKHDHLFAKFQASLMALVDDDE